MATCEVFARRRRRAVDQAVGVVEIEARPANPAARVVCRAAARSDLVGERNADRAGGAVALVTRRRVGWYANVR